MKSNNWQSIVVMLLAIVGGIAILGMLGRALLHLFNPGPGGIGVVAGGVSESFFRAVVVVMVLAIVALLWRRWKR